MSKSIISETLQDTASDTINEIISVESNDITLESGPSGVSADKGYVPPVWGTAYISEVNIAWKVKSDAQVATNKNSDHVQKVI